MAKLMGLSKVFFVAVLFITGCAQINAYAQPDDCRSCHVSNLAPGAKDFSAYYAEASTHHPVGIKYPASVKADPNFFQPNSRRGDIAFFDRNGNGQPDPDEVQLFGKGGMNKIECASCHLAHGRSAAPARAAPHFYLRVDDTGSELCITCHNK